MKTRVIAMRVDELLALRVEDYAKALGTKRSFAMETLIRRGLQRAPLTITRSPRGSTMRQAG